VGRSQLPGRRSGRAYMYSTERRRWGVMVLSGGNIEMQAGILKRNGGMHTGDQALQDSLSFVLLI